MEIGIVREKIEEVLSDTWKTWVGEHRRPQDALRWWVAWNESQQAVDSNNSREWAELFEDGIKPLPRSMRKLVEYVADLCEDEGELEAYLEDMKIFFC